MILHGLGLMVSAGLPLAGILHAIHHNTVRAFHAACLDDPFTLPWNWALRRHITGPCADCSMSAELAIAHIR